MKKSFWMLIIFIFIIFFPFILAANQHGVNGFVDDSGKGISPNGMAVTFEIADDQGIYCTLSDIVGVNGNAKKDNWYAIDVGNCKQPWNQGDLVYIFIGNSINNASTQVILTEEGNDQAPDTQLSDISFCGDDFCDALTENCSSCPEDCIPECNENGICEPFPNSTHPRMCETPENCIDCYGCDMDGICEIDIGEDCFNCPFDCHCPDGLCQLEFGENNETCQQDCRCGNLICENITGLCFTFIETTLNCPIDCPGCICGNEICEPDCGENIITCCIDCCICDYDGICELGESFPYCPDCELHCGNLICEPELGETPENCPTDCASCGNGICEPDLGENWRNCPQDCYFARCGDQACELAENSGNCCMDCGCPSGFRLWLLPIKTYKCEKNKCLAWWNWWLFIILALIITIIIILLKRKCENKRGKFCKFVQKLKFRKRF